MRRVLVPCHQEANGFPLPVYPTKVVLAGTGGVKPDKRHFCDYGQVVDDNDGGEAVLSCCIRLLFARLFVATAPGATWVTTLSAWAASLFRADMENHPPLPDRTRPLAAAEYGILDRDYLIGHYR